MIRKLRYLLFAFVLLIPYAVNAEEVEYTLFDSVITVNENRTLDITENYKLYFIENVDKITRKIKMNQIVVRPDNKKTQLSTKIENINSDAAYSTKRINGKQNIFLNVDGAQDEVYDYSLSYKYNLGKDSLKNGDEFYYEIVNNVDAPISNFIFTIKFPKEININDIYYAIDNKYNLNKDDITYELNGNVLTGSLNILLSNNQSFSIYVKLPKGYFKGATDNFNYLNYLLISIPLFGLVALIYFFIKYGKGIALNVRRTSNIYKGFDSAEIGYLYKGKLEEQDLTSVVLYLATKGYLKIVEHDDGYKLGKDNSFHFVKLNDYDKNNAAQELLFNELFRGRNKTELKDIEYHFAQTFKEAHEMLDNEDNHKKLFFNDIKNVRLISIILIILSIIFNNYRSIYLFTNSYLLIIPIIAMMLFGLYVVFLSNASGILKIIVATLFLSMSLYIGISPIIFNMHYLIIYLIETILIASMCILYTRLSDRTKYGSMVLSEAYGLKYYLETISASELKSKIEENSNYYYDMIPYAYVLDSLECWIKKGRDIITNPPDWYVPSSEFTLNNLEKFIKNVLYTTTLVMMRQVYSNSDLITYTNDKVKTNLND